MAKAKTLTAAEKAIVRLAKLPQSELIEKIESAYASLSKATANFALTHGIKVAALVDQVGKLETAADMLTLSKGQVSRYGLIARTFYKADRSALPDSVEALYTLAKAKDSKGKRVLATPEAVAEQIESGAITPELTRETAETAIGAVETSTKKAKAKKAKKAEPEKVETPSETWCNALQRIADGLKIYETDHADVKSLISRLTSIQKNIRKIADTFDAPKENVA